MKSKCKQLARDLLDSVHMRNINRVRELLAHGADINARDAEHDQTPLMFAVVLAGVDMVQLLLASGAKVEARDGWGRTALFYAPVSSEAFEILLRAGAEVHARDDEGNTILMQKVSESASLAEVDELLKLGIDPGVRNENGETALDLAEGLLDVGLFDRCYIRWNYDWLAGPTTSSARAAQRQAVRLLTLERSDAMYLYIGINGRVAAIDPQTGGEVWRTELPSGGFFSSGSDVCVLEHEGQVFAGCNGYVFALDGANGNILWENGLEGMGHNDVTLSIAGKSIQFVATHTHTQS